MTLRKSGFSIVFLSALLTVVEAPKPSAVFRAAAYAQSAPSSFPLPSTVSRGTTVKVDGSDSMLGINRSLKQRFESQYPDTAVELANQGTDKALQAVLDGSIDLAAIGRPLTDAEKAQGLIEVPVRRDKIAIFVGSGNSFNGDLTFEQFARMFRGEITDWSEVGGTAGAIRFIDRSDSDTRKSLGNYSVFKSAPFSTGSNAIQVEDDAGAVISQIGSDGISYAVADQVLGRDDVRVLPMHQTMPDDPRYPYSQPRSYVYKGAASPAIAAFLGYATSAPGQAAIATVQTDSSGAGIASAGAATTAATSDVAASPETGSPETSASPEAVVGAETPTDGGDRSTAGWLPWLLLPLAGVLGLLLWGLKGRNSSATTSVTTEDNPQPDLAPPDSEASLAERTGAVVAADRSGLPERQSDSDAEVNAETDAAVAPVAEDLPDVRGTDAEVNPPVIGAIGTVLTVETGAAALAGLAALNSRDRRSRIVLTPRTTSQGYAYWETPEAEKDVLRQQGGEQLTLWIGDATDLDLSQQAPCNLEVYPCLETAQDQFVVLPETDRDYIAEIGYLTADGQRLILARSQPVRISEVSEVRGAVPDLVIEPPVSEAPTVNQEESTVIQRDMEPIETRVVPDNPDGDGAPPAAAIAGLAVAASQLDSLSTNEDPTQAGVEAARFDVGQTELSSEALASVDENLPDLPAGYGESWITLLPRDPQWAYAYWDIPNYQKHAARQQGGERLALRFYDVTEMDLSQQNPYSLQQYECDEMTRDWYIPVPISDRDYIAEIGYVTGNGRWIMLARSNPARIPPLYPTDWQEEQFVSIDWEDELRGRTFLELVPPQQRTRLNNSIYDRIFGLAESAESQRVAGSLFGSMQQVPGSVFSSYALASGSGLGIQTASGMGIYGQSSIGMYSTSGAGMLSGIGMYTTSGMGMSGVGMSGMGIYSASGMGMSGIGMYSESGVGMMSGAGMYSMSGIGLYSLSGIGMMSGAGLYSDSGIGMMSGIGLYSMSGAGMMSGIGMYTASGVGMSGIGMYSMSGIGMSGVGFSASMPPLRPRKFWLIADAELIVYGATEPDATVTIAGRPVQLNPDGTFRFQMSFQDGMIDFPILAVAADGEQNRSVHLRFNRNTIARHTNTRDEAQDELF